MVDREARNIAAEVLRHFISGQSYNFDFEENEPNSEDPIISAIWESIWPFYCDLRKHKMRDDWKIPDIGKRKIANWLLFLYTNEEYKWPKISYPGVRPQEYGYVARLFRRHKIEEHFMSQGPYEIWPFIDKESFENAKQNPRLLSNVT